jgi:hypothetical protein
MMHASLSGLFFRVVDGEVRDMEASVEGDSDKHFKYSTARC